MTPDSILTSVQIKVKFSNPYDERHILKCLEVHLVIRTTQRTTQRQLFTSTLPGYRQSHKTEQPE